MARALAPQPENVNQNRYAESRNNISTLEIAQEPVN